MLRKIRSEKGLTLIEILVVIVIIGLLIGFLLPNVNSFTKNSEVNVVESDLRLIKSSLQQHYVDKPDEKITKELLRKYLGYPAKVVSAAGVDPVLYQLEKKDPWGNPYQVLVGYDDEIFVLMQSLGPDAKDSVKIKGINGDFDDDIVILHLPEL